MILSHSKSGEAGHWVSPLLRFQRQDCHYALFCDNLQVKCIFDIKFSCLRGLYSAKPYLHSKFGTATITLFVVILLVRLKVHHTITYTSMTSSYNVERNIFGMKMAWNYSHMNIHMSAVKFWYPLLKMFWMFYILKWNIKCWYNIFFASLSDLNLMWNKEICRNRIKAGLFNVLIQEIAEYGTND